MKIEITFNHEEQELIRTILKSKPETEAHFRLKVGDHDALIKFPVGEKRENIEIFLTKEYDEHLTFIGTAKDFGIDLNPPQRG